MDGSPMLPRIFEYASPNYLAWVGVGVDISSLFMYLSMSFLFQLKIQREEERRKALERKREEDRQKELQQRKLEDQSKKVMSQLVKFSSMGQCYKTFQNKLERVSLASLSSLV
jgi:hypothetical protein